MTTDPFADFKARQREVWSLGNFGDVAVFTAQPAAHLVEFAGVAEGQEVLDVGTGTGVVAVTAARAGAIVTGLDLTPKLLEQAKQHAAIAGISIAWKEADAESLPLPDGTFDVVLSQFGHMFAPRPDVATREMLRVLKPGGTIAFATWPPETFPGRSFPLSAKYVTPPVGIPAPTLWGDPSAVRERLGNAVRQLHLERGTMSVPTLSPRHFVSWQAATIGPVIRIVGALQKEPAKLEAFLKESEELVGAFFVDNVVRHEYLLTRATKI